MAVADLEKAGWIARAAWYVNHGRSRSKFIDSIRAAYPKETWGAVQSIWDSGVKAYRAGVNSMATSDDGRVPASTVPGYRPGRTGYRYSVIGAITPSDGSEPRHVSTTIDSANQLTTEQIRSVFTDKMGLDIPGDLERTTPPGVGITWTLDDIDIQSLERW